MSISVTTRFNRSKVYGEFRKYHLVVHLSRKFEPVCVANNGQMLTFIKVFIYSQRSRSVLAAVRSTCVSQICCTKMRKTRLT